MRENSKRRVAAWAGAGLLVAVAWWIYALAWAPTPITMTAPIVWTLVRFSCPVVMVGTYLHLGVSLFWVLIANATTYALIGWLVESLHWRTASTTQLQIRVPASLSRMLNHLNC